MIGWPSGAPCRASTRTATTAATSQPHQGSHRTMASNTATAAAALAARIWPRVPRVFLPSRWAFIASWCPDRPAATAIDSSSHPSVQCHQVISRPVSRPIAAQRVPQVQDGVDRGADPVVAGLVPVQAKRLADGLAMRSRRRCPGMIGSRLASPVPEVSR